MTVTVTLSLAAEEFPLGEVFRALPAARIDLERVIPSGDALLPYVWVYSEAHDTIGHAIEAAEHVQRVEVLDSLSDRTLLRIEWKPSIDGVLTAINEQRAAILSASSDGGRWYLELRFPTAAATSAFQRACRDSDVHVDITSVHDTSKEGPDQPNELTSAQREVLELALDEGYFDIPRGTTLVDLAGEIGVSDQAVSERLRRAQRKLAAQYLRT